MCKSFRNLIVCGVLLMAVSAMGMLQNASFEIPKDPNNFGSDVAQGWDRWGHWINRETGWTPTRSGQCLLGYHHYQIEEDSDSGIYQDVPDVPQGKTCTFQVYAYRDMGTDAEDVELRLEPLDGGEALGCAHYGMADLREGEWNALSVSARSVAPGIRVLIIVKPKRNGDRQGALKFDDAELQVAQ